MMSKTPACYAGSDGGTGPHRASIGKAREPETMEIMPRLVSLNEVGCHASDTGAYTKSMAAHPGRDEKAGNCRDTVDHGHDIRHGIDHAGPRGFQADVSKLGEKRLELSGNGGKFRCARSG